MWARCELNCMAFGVRTILAVSCVTARHMLWPQMFYMNIVIMCIPSDYVERLFLDWNYIACSRCIEFSLAVWVSLVALAAIQLDGFWIELHCVRYGSVGFGVCMCIEFYRTVAEKLRAELKYRSQPRMPEDMTLWWWWRQWLVRCRTAGSGLNESNRMRWIINEIGWHVYNIYLQMQLPATQFWCRIPLVCIEMKWADILAEQLLLPTNQRNLCICF